MAKRRTGRMLAAALLLPLTGCAAQAPCLFGTCNKSASRPPVKPDPEYRVAAGDTLEIRTPVSKDPIVAEVLPDGRIEIDDQTVVRVDGMTTDEIRIQLASFDPAIEPKVAVRAYNSQFMYVFGEKDREEPQAIPYRGKESITELMKRVGCRSCRLGYRVRVVRPGKTIGAVPDVFTVHLDKSMKIRDMNTNLNGGTQGADSSESKEEILQAAAALALEPGDYVYIERDMTDPNPANWLQPKSDSRLHLPPFHRSSQHMHSWAKK